MKSEFIYAFHFGKDILCHFLESTLFKFRLLNVCYNAPWPPQSGRNGIVDVLA